ncbi:uncharacterized protein LOC119197931 [Pungitius pungitius]|uniref:uncharacterized protein LOC119197931 n=1 Tax=Pungitius pungitius TaxID=134920 RepID=UPI002E0D5DE0
MSARVFELWRRPREQELPGVEAAQSRDEDDQYRQLSLCPVFSRGHDHVLLLPCSHPMCAHCIAAVQETRSGRSRGQSGGQRSVAPVACLVPCQYCRRPVELPCRTWSSATSCLPKHPNPSLLRVSGGTDRKVGQSEDQSQHVQGVSRCRDASDTAEPGCLHGCDAASSSVAPVDGDVDLREEEMERSVSGLHFALDCSNVPPSLALSNFSLTVTYQGENPPQGHDARRSTTCDPLPQVSADVVIARGQYYWEVDVCNSSVYRIGVRPLDGCGGWWLERRGPAFRAVYDGNRETLRTVPPRVKTLGVFLNVGGGALSFHNPLTREHLATLPTRFGPAGVLPALGLGQGRLRLRCGLPPPPHVFLGRDSDYRERPGGGRWSRDAPFQSVKRVIQRFEELAVSDSDSGLVSGFGSSCCTVDLATGTFPRGGEGQE